MNGTSEVRLARLNATNGAVDTSFRASPSAAVNALALSSNRLFVGGAFISISGVPRNNLASLNTAAGAVEGWNPNVDSNVADLQLSPDQATVYIAGDFGHVPQAQPEQDALSNVQLMEWRHNELPSLGQRLLFARGQEFLETVSGRSLAQGAQLCLRGAPPAGPYTWL